MWLHEFDAAMWQQVVWDLFGSDDLGETARRRWAETQRPQYWLHRILIAREGDVPVGVVNIELPQEDNLHIGYISLAVHREHRGRGVGSALFDAAVDDLLADGRTTIQMWTYEPLEPTGERRLRGTEGDGAIDPGSPSAQFLLKRGFTLMQVDTMSAMDLPSQWERDAQAVDARERTPLDYEVVQWVGVTPDRWLEDLAVLHRAMSTDTPTGGAELEEEVFDAERVRSGDEVWTRAGLGQLYTAVLHAPTGRLVGFSRVFHDPGKPSAADQWETLVLKEHRGHGLGWLMKTHSHAALGRRWPAVTRIVTGNASENAHMLAINHRLGFEPIAASGWFERKESRGAQ